MNYINILDENPTIYIAINYDFNLEEGRNGDDIDFFMYKDGSSVNLENVLQGESLEWSGNITIGKYYQKVAISQDIVDFLENGKTYSLIAIDGNDKIVYRGKVEVTDQNLLDYSVNKQKYKHQSNENNYTILD
jgi:hypothetical protein